MARDRISFPWLPRSRQRPRTGAARRLESTRIDFIGQVKDEHGKIVQNVRDMVDVKLKGEVAAQLAKRPVVYDTGLPYRGAYNLKFLARDNESGKMGTYRPSS